MADQNFDTVILGGGPGGYVAAIRAAQLGMRTAVVERENLGGICLNWGCIPTKALLRVSEIRHILDRLDEFGLSAGEVTFDLEKIVKRSRQIAGQLSNGVEFLMRKHKVTVFNGEGRLLGSGKLEVAKNGKTFSELTAKHIIIATGARARELPGLEVDGKLVWSYKEAMVPKTMPKRLLVVGSGAIGMEFASFYSDLGADVTVVETLPRILPVEDEEISALAEKQFKKQGMTIFTSASVAMLKKKGKNVMTAEIKMADGKSIKHDFDRAILAIGITGNVENIGLEECEVKVNLGHIETGQWMETSARDIFAIGDVTGPPWLAHKAMHEGVLCVEKIAGVEGVQALEASHIPGCTYCRPQIASVGLSEEAAMKKGHEVRVGRFPFMGNGKAIALGEAEGMIKTVFHAKSGELLGAHMIGAEVTELIQGYTIAKTMECTEADLIHTIFPHPTLSEMMHESVLDAFDRVLHI